MFFRWKKAHFRLYMEGVLFFGQIFHTQISQKGSDKKDV